MPERALFSVCGDVDPRLVQRRIERGLAGWKPGRELAPSPFQALPLGVRSGCFESDRAQVHLFVGHQGIRRGHPDYPALVVMDHVLGTGPGFSNRVSQRLRDRDGLAYTVHADVSSSAGRFPGMFTAYIGTSPEHAERAVAGFLEETT